MQTKVEPKFNIGDTVCLSADPNASNLWRVVERYWKETEGVLYDLAGRSKVQGVKEGHLF